MDVSGSGGGEVLESVNTVVSNSMDTVTVEEASDSDPVGDPQADEQARIERSRQIQADIKAPRKHHPGPRFKYRGVGAVADRGPAAKRVEVLPGARGKHTKVKFGPGLDKTYGYVMSADPKSAVWRSRGLTGPVRITRPPDAVPSPSERRQAMNYWGARFVHGQMLELLDDLITHSWLSLPQMRLLRHRRDGRSGRVDKRVILDDLEALEQALGLVRRREMWGQVLWQATGTALDATGFGGKAPGPPALARAYHHDGAVWLAAAFEGLLPVSEKLWQAIEQVGATPTGGVLVIGDAEMRRAAWRDLDVMPGRWGAAGVGEMTPSRLAGWINGGLPTDPRERRLWDYWPDLVVATAGGDVAIELELSPKRPTNANLQRKIRGYADAVASGALRGVVLATSTQTDFHAEACEQAWIGACEAIGTAWRPVMVRIPPSRWDPFCLAR